MDRRDWSRAEVEQLVALRKSGLKLAACARRLGRTARSVRAKAWRLGLAPFPESAPRRKPGSLLRGVRAVWRPGMTDQELADRLGTSDDCARRARKRCGYPVARGRVFGVKIRPGPLAALVAEGLTNPQIAGRLGVTREGVWQARKRLGV